MLPVLLYFSLANSVTTSYSLSLSSVVNVAVFTLTLVVREHTVLCLWRESVYRFVLVAGIAHLVLNRFRQCHLYLRLVYGLAKCGTYVPLQQCAVGRMGSSYATEQGLS